MARRRSRRGSWRPNSRRQRYPGRGRVLWILFLTALGAVLVFWLVVYPRIHSTIATFHPAYLVLGDTSRDSTSASRAAAQRILSEITRYAALNQGFVAATPFQDHAQANVDWRYQVFVPSSAHDSTAARQELATAESTFRGRTKGFLEHPRDVTGTDIIGALLSASDEFTTFPRASSRTIILVSNMANFDTNKRGISLRKALPLSTIHDQISNLASKTPSQIAGLVGDCIYIIGSGEFPNDKSITAEVEGTIREFWNEYFERAQTQRPHWVSDLTGSPGCP